jgi:glutathione S-transferase
MNYSAEKVDISSKENPQKQPWFLAINPNGRM